MSRRFFDPQPFSAGQRHQLGESASHHIGKVLRMRQGDALTLFNGEGGEYQGSIIAVNKKSVEVHIERFDDIDRCPPLAVTVALPLIKGERMDYAIQKATELGASRFDLLLCERSDVRLAGDRLEKKISHFHQVAVSACEQCGMNRVPTISGAFLFGEYIAQAAADVRLIAHPGESPLATSPAPGQSLILLTGPEGGFSDAEITAATAAGFASFALGERVLRAETAPVALLAALWARLSL